MNRNFKYFTLTAFTLAEVLITLGIIGVVAAMTIPTLINRTNDAEFKSMLKKEYSVFNQALLSIAADNGGDFKAALTSMSSSNGQASDSLLWRDLFATKLKVIKTCDAGVGSSLTYGGCFGSSYKYYVNTSDPMTSQAWINTTTRYSGILADGAAYSIFQWENGNVCAYSAGDMTNLCGALTIDVNGSKAPNKFGKDMFCLGVQPTGITPITIYSDDCGGGASDGIGTYCAYKVLMGIDY